MRYYTLKISVSTDGTETRDLRGFDTQDEAIIRFHSDLSSNIGKVTRILEKILDENGVQYASELWESSSTSEITE